jgi:hypothetical protein
MLPPLVSSLDWDTTDPLQAMTLGKALSHRGYVFWRPQQLQWIVLDPTQLGHHEMVHKTYPPDPLSNWWVLLVCTCPNGNNPDGPCVHKAAVHQHSTQMSEYKFYTEG